MTFTGMILRPDGSAGHDVAAEGSLERAQSLGHDAGQDLLARAGKNFLAESE
jgi:hydroxymethylbilane synthase